MKLDELVTRLINVHSEDRCIGEYCTIHNPSDHHMKDWDVTLRSSGLIERLCPDNGVGHPDPDSWPAMNKLWQECYGDEGAFQVHGCDGCCWMPA